MSVVDGVSRQGGVLAMGGVPLDRALAALRRLEPDASACWVYDLDLIDSLPDILREHHHVVTERDVERSPDLLSLIDIGISHRPPSDRFRGREIRPLVGGCLSPVPVRVGSG